MKQATLVTHSEDETAALGQRIASLAAAGDVYLLCGELGAGKTCLIRGLAAGLGAAEPAFSPSFVLMREYHGRLPLFHMDLYRLSALAEIADLGIDEYLQGEGVCAIEWAERAAGILPEECLSIELDYEGSSEDTRMVRLAATGQRYETLLSHLMAHAGDQVAWN